MGKIKNVFTGILLGILFTAFILYFFPAIGAKTYINPSFHLSDGSIYKGRLNASGEMEGVGVQEWKNGEKYEGEFHKGLFSGRGKFINAFSIYEGTFNKGYFNGQGKLTYNDGGYEDGIFLNGYLNGKGIRVGEDKSVYVGEFKEGLFDGHGEITYTNGTKYVGQFSKGKFQGKGLYKLNTGITYDGAFEHNNFEGKGVMNDSLGETYEGYFKNWNLEGEGVKTDDSHNKWTGNFENGVLNSKGTYLGADGDAYEGDFKYTMFHGQGTLTQKNGDVYVGEFKHGYKNGRGVLTLKEAKDGVRIIHGRWESDQLIESDEKVKRYLAEDVIDYAIYHQKEELEKTLNLVKPSNPNKTELYSLVIAAYGTQEVFHRESYFIEKQFQDLFHNKTTSIYLTNSQQSLNEHPLATLKSIEQSINRLAAQMDKEKDIFFLYITSHGSKDKKISLKHNGLALTDIDSKWLGERLKSSGIKHKVIVLSACYSGGFIDDVKDDNSIIITSASADRTSFGCGDDSDMTYFAKAYFKEGLSSNLNFVDAFYMAKPLIEKWEISAKQKPSNPQIFVSSKVSDYLKFWKK